MSIVLLCETGHKVPFPVSKGPITSLSVCLGKGAGVENGGSSLSESSEYTLMRLPAFCNLRDCITGSSSLSVRVLFGGFALCPLGVALCLISLRTREIRRSMPRVLPSSSRTIISTLIISGEGLCSCLDKPDKTCLCFLEMSGEDGRFSVREARGVREAFTASLECTSFVGALFFRVASNIWSGTSASASTETASLGFFFRMGGIRIFLL